MQGRCARRRPSEKHQRAHIVAIGYVSFSTHLRSGEKLTCRFDQYAGADDAAIAPRRVDQPEVSGLFLVLAPDQILWLSSQRNARQHRVHQTFCIAAVGAETRVAPSSWSPRATDMEEAKPAAIGRYLHVMIHWNASRIRRWNRGVQDRRANDQLGAAGPQIRRWMPSSFGCGSPAHRSVPPA